MNIPSPISTARHLRQRLPRVCVAIVGKSASEMVEKAEQVARDNSFLEFRLDYLSQPATVLPKLKGFIEYHPHLTLVATCRRVKSGGKFRGSVAAEVDILVRVADMGCHLVDIEL